MAVATTVAGETVAAVTAAEAMEAAVKEVAARAAKATPEASLGVLAAVGRLVAARAAAGVAEAAAPGGMGATHRSQEQRGGRAATAVAASAAQ